MGRKHHSLIKSTPLLVLLAAVSLACGHDRTQVLDQARLAGNWSGSGTFFDAALQKRIGSLPFTAQFATDSSGSGTVGGAALQIEGIKKTGDHIEIIATLKGTVGSDAALNKDHLVLLITALSETAMQAEFHLKSSFGYDGKMTEGRVAFTRNP